MSYACPCCGYLTLSEELSGSFEICPICYWEDDIIQLKGGANRISLNEAKKNFAEFGAIQAEFIKDVRKPLPDEYP